ncbi:hypothetical protein [Cloacibacterium caeni]|uniref:hypothetical protein n=1 Tax=Cloacibacterium caeni TaxID=2004710 RepID=UPI001BCB952F|nr:hypothetical protein [Cloacibacterium caeni]
MKKYLFITLFFISIAVFSQEKYKASDYSLPNNVKSYNTFVYKYDVELGKYFVIEKHIRIFEKGLIKYDYVLDNYLDRFTQIKRYTYNAQNQLISIETADDYEKPQYYPYIDFFYENGKLSKISEVLGNKRIFTDFNYDKKGRILKEKRYQDDKLVLSTVDYNYISDKNYTTKKVVFINDDSKKIVDEVFENNLKISEEIDDPAAKISYTYQYDKNGNEVMKSDMATSFDSHYVYGKTGAILKSKKTEYDDLEFDIVNYFEFSEITYEDGSTEGSRVFDKEFAKSFNMSVLSYDAIDDLK